LPNREDGFIIIVMNHPFNIKLIPASEMSSIIPLVSLLNHGEIARSLLEKRLKDMLLLGNYECIGVYDKSELIGICGIWTLHKFYAGKHLEPDNVFIKESYRSKGVGKLMIDFLVQRAKEIGCDGSEVNCYLGNEKGIRFWEQQGYKPIGYHFLLKFD